MFQDFLKDLAEGLTGDFTAKRNIPNLNVPRPNIVHEVKNLYGTKSKNCNECRAKAVGPHVRVPQTTMGCL